MLHAQPIDLIYFTGGLKSSRRDPCILSAPTAEQMLKNENATWKAPTMRTAQRPWRTSTGGMPADCASRQKAWRHAFFMSILYVYGVQQSCSAHAVARWLGRAGLACHRPAARVVWFLSRDHCHWRRGLTLTPSYALLSTTKSSGASLTCIRKGCSYGGTRGDCKPRHRKVSPATNEEADQRSSQTLCLPPGALSLGLMAHLLNPQLGLRSR